MAIETTATRERGGGARTHGIDAPGRSVWWNLALAALYEHALAAGDGTLAEGGALVVSTGVHTGRAPKDKYRRPGAPERGPRLVGRHQPAHRPRHPRGPRGRLREHLGAAPTST